MKNYDIAIIGGGAAAFAAAISAKEYSRDKKIVILERMPRVLKKLLATGNGSCNLSNKSIGSENYHGEGRKIFDGIYRNFDLERTAGFFENIGIKLTEGEDGKLYPMSKSAAAVSDALRFKAENIGCETICGFSVRTVNKKDGIFIIFSDGEKISAKSVIVASGGCAQKNLGSDGSGFDILRSFGHRQTKLFPAICPYKTEKEKIKSLRGIKAEAVISVTAGKRVISREKGELLFTEYGLSGPAIFRLSRSISENISLSPLLIIDLIPETGQPELENLLYKFKNSVGYLPLSNLLCGFLPKMLAAAVIKEAALNPSDKVENLDSGEIRKIACAAKNFKIKPSAPMGFDKAQVTAGGISTRDFDPVTLESRLCKNLFAAGEVLDIDGDCGGYNLQWAWSSGYTAGINAAKKE